MAETYEPLAFANASTADRIARSLYPNETSISIIEHSGDNIVALVGSDYAVRFPRGQNAYLRSLYERHVLRSLESVDTVAIPRVLDEHDDPPYVVTSFLKGHHVSSSSVGTFSSVEQRDFGIAVGRFAYAIHSALKVELERPVRRGLGLDELPNEEPWPTYFARVVRDAPFASEAQHSLAQRCFSDWARRCDVPPTVVVHDDLHTENMMFDGHRLVGVLDFADTNLGTPEQELRQLYRVNDEVTLAGVREYERLSGTELDVEGLRLWAIMKELADYSKALTVQATSHHSFVRSCRNLNAWLPAGNWGDGLDLSVLDGYQ